MAQRKRTRAGSLGLAVVAAALLGTATVASVPARAQAPVPAAAQPVLDPAVAEALRRMSATLAGARSLTVQFTSLREAALLAGSDQLVTLSASVAVGIRRPGELAALVGSDRGSFRLWYDGTTATLLSLTANAYARAGAPGDLETLFDALEERLGVEIPLRDLLAADPYAVLTGIPTSGVHVGRTVVNGALCEHYALRNSEVDWQVWIAVGERPVPCRLVVVDRTALGSPRSVLEFQDWNLAPRLGDSTFDFVAPANAQQVPWIERSAARPATEVR
jgi:hypothetical protein